MESVVWKVLQFSQIEIAFSASTKTGPQSRALCGAVCIINSCSTLLNCPTVSLLIWFILFSMFFVLIHNYTLCFTGSPCRNFSYYNYISIWPYYIVSHLCLSILLAGKYAILLQSANMYARTSHSNTKYNKKYNFLGLGSLRDTLSRFAKVNDDLTIQNNDH